MAAYITLNLNIEHDDGSFSWHVSPASLYECYSGPESIYLPYMLCF